MTILICQNKNSGYTNLALIHLILKYHNLGSKGQSLGKSFFNKDVEETLATESYPNAAENPNSFGAEMNDDHEFKEIFKVLDELEDDSNIFGNINSKFEADVKHEETATKEDEKRDEYEQKKETFLGNSPRFMLYYRPV